MNVKDNKKILVASLLVVLLIVSLLAKNLTENKVRNDSKRFQEEYESLNGTVRESDGAIYQSISIPIDNPIVYVDTKEALRVMKEEKAIVYIGANWCPWCRNAVPVLLDVAKEKKIEKIYYLDLEEEKSSYEIQDGKLVTTQKGSDGYYELLKYLDSELKEYILTDENGKKYDTKEKRIYMPFVIASNQGKITKTHVGTVSLNSNQTKYSELTEEQHQELQGIYSNLINSLSSSCNDGSCD